MIALKNKKGENEIISTILLMLIMVIVVGIIIAGVTSNISKGKEKVNYDNSIKVRDQLFNDIKDLYNSPIESTKEINVSLSNLILDINAEGDIIEICSIGKKFDFFDDGKRVEQDNNKYVYRELQKVCAGVAFENIDLVRSYQISNRGNLRLVIKKITENKIQFSLDNETAAEWYTQKSSYIYDETISGDWKYRKKILINSGDLIGDLNNLSVQLDLEDEDLMSYANIDASDIIFTLGDGVTKIKREIVDYNSDTGALSVLIKGPQFNYGPDINNPVYDENTYRKKITIDYTKVDGDLNNFPILISIKDENLVNLANSDGNDIYFTSSDGTTRLKREIESFEDINSYRKKITIDHTKVDDDLTDFPMLISIVDENLVSYGANADGNDIYFTESDGETRLRREIEDYNSETGALVAWVKISELSSTTDTDIYMYFGDSEENNTNDTDVWDSNFVGVWHSNDLTTSTIKDSTSNNNTGTKIESNGPTEIIGKLGKAQNFDGSNDYISISSATIETASFWANFNSVTAAQYFLGGTSKGVRYSGTDFLAYNGSSGYITLNWTKENAWKHFTITRVNANDYNIYIDGNYLGVTTAGTSGADIAITLIGKRSDGYLFNGPIDEIRISNSIRSESWIKAEYNNQNAPESFYTVGDLEDVAINLVAWVKIPELSSTTDTDIYMNFGNPDENSTNDTDVWDDNFILVNHLNEGSVDSTSNSNTGTNQNITYETDRFSKENKSYLFNDVNAQITNNNASMGILKGTVSFWVYRNGNNEWQSIIAKMTDFNGYKVGIDYANRFNIMLMDGTGSSYALNLTSPTAIPQYDWTHGTVTFNETNQSDVNIYINGTLNKTGTLNANTTIASGIVCDIGHSSSTGLGGGYLDARLDEIKVSNSVRSGSWVKTEYNNQSAPESFYDVGALEEVENILNYEILPNPLTAPIYIYFGNPDANISDNSIEDSNTATISIGVLEKS